jgi:Transcriptional activator TraM
VLDTQKLIVEIAERHHVRVEPDDPVFVVVTVNQRVMEDTIREMLKVMEATLARFDASIEHAENRAGRILAQSVKESSEGIRRAVHEDIGAASIKATELVHAIDRAHSERALKYWSSIAILCITFLCAGCFWLGRLTALR